MNVKTQGYRGRTRKMATVESNDPNMPKAVIRVSAQVEPVIMFAPFNKLVLTTTVGKPARQEITLTNLFTKPVEVVEVQHNLGDQVKTELVIQEKGKVYKVVVSTTAERKARLSGWLRFVLRNAPASYTSMRAYLHVWEPKEKEKGAGGPPGPRPIERANQIH